MLASGATEGFGLLLLVPMLQALGNNGVSGRTGQWLSAAGLPVALGPLLLLFVGLVAVRSIVNLARALEGQKFQVRIVDSLRNRAWSALLHCDWQVASAMRQSDNASMLITNIDRVGHGVNSLLAALTMGTTLFAMGMASLAISPAIAAVALVGGGAVLLAYRGMVRQAGRLGERLGLAYRQIHGALSESLGALRVIKSYGREDEAAARLAKSFRFMRGAERAYLRNSSLAKAVLEGLGAICVALLVWIAVRRWHYGPAEIVPLVALFARCLPLLSAFQGMWQDWAHSRPALDEIATLIATAEAAREADDTGGKTLRLDHGIAFSGVTFRFPGRDRPALDNIDLAIPTRGITALVGPSGAGKSTLADLAGGLIVPHAGEVRIDGVALGEDSKRAWRRSVAYVQQEPVLFTGTVRDNLAWAEPSASDGEMRNALSRASAAFVDALPAGLDTLVGEGGRQLSGGERQRIVLARALLRRPCLLILDEATSALDPDNEAAIAQALDRLRTEMAILVICHRGELRNIADRIVSLESGRIVAVEHPQKDCN